MKNVTVPSKSTNEIKFGVRKLPWEKLPKSVRVHFPDAQAMSISIGVSWVQVIN